MNYDWLVFIAKHTKRQAAQAVAKKSAATAVSSTQLDHRRGPRHRAQPLAVVVQSGKPVSEICKPFEPLKHARQAAYVDAGAADLRDFKGRVERDMMHAEPAPLLSKIEELRDEILELRQVVSARSGMRGSNRRQKQALV